MKIRSKKSRKKLYATLVVLVLALGAGGYLVVASNQDNKHETEPTREVVEKPTTDTASPNDDNEKIQQDAAKKQQFLDSDKKEPVDKTKSNDSPTSNSNDKPAQSEIDLLVKYESKNLSVISKLPGVSSGVCNLVLQNNNKTVKKSAEVIYAPTYSTCMGFSIPADELSAGSWQIKLSVERDSKILGSKSTNYTIDKL